MQPRSEQCILVLDLFQQSAIRYRMDKNIHPLAHLPAIVRAVLALRPCPSSAVVTVYQPVIRRNEYEAFRAILNDSLPATFGTWLHVRRENGMHMVRHGHEVADVEVRPDEFASYCSAAGQKLALQDLWLFAHEVTQQRSSMTLLSNAVEAHVQALAI